ncbi:MAG TPA: hypothetical protein EYN67_15080 [Flavobacteriales bacterium]|nr:hypothetical protein [Flavobacteriales bacterium]HHZ96834.1 hypothetical protein [Flavobacteriales bacterium]HIB76678.1 hypothetical protein [Flavobacteriales bacterium]
MPYKKKYTTHRKKLSLFTPNRKRAVINQAKQNARVDRLSKAVTALKAAMRGRKQRHNNWYAGGGGTLHGGRFRR